SDDQYLRQYNFASTDVLENELYLERFSGRNYAVGRILSFQDTRIREEQTDQPGVLPELDLRFVGDPNALLGGRWNLNLSALNLQRDGSGQDMSRVVAEAGWEKRYVTGGLLSTIALSARGDAYQIHDRDLSLLPAAASGTDAEETETRAFARAHMTTSYPLVRAFERMQAVIEPVAALTIAPVIAAQNNAVPNEDSQDVQLDASNLFNADRFPGMDRIEDGSRATYGLRTGLYGYQGSYLTAFAGQSRRFDQNDNPFPGGSGLSRQESDIVGQLAAQYDGRFGADYRFQIDSAQLDSQRHELDAYGKWGRLRLDSRYLFAKGLEGTDLTESREQILGAAAFDLTKNWTLRGGALYDLGESPGLRKALLGIDYLGCCVNFSLAAERSLTRDSSGDRGTDIMLRMGLKNIGDFQTSGSGDWTAGNHAK
ncbi:MAG: LPS-assembly protein LptD, partial [Alphaproteobacteria bacterium]|nr:LPS-assembly protein LptD [Alphaproteobacteria bacterium]